MKTYPPRPQSRPDNLGLWGRLGAYRRDLFGSQPERLYSAKIARSKTPLFTSFFVNDPKYVDMVLALPKPKLQAAALQELLGASVFVTSGETWARQRRIVDAAFLASGAESFFPAMFAAGRAAVARLQSGTVEIEHQCSYAAADVIFRTLFSQSLGEARARRVFEAFQAYQRTQPMLSWRDLARLRRRPARFGKRAAQGRVIRSEIAGLVDGELARPSDDRPQNLATRLITTLDPETSSKFDREELIDQVAIFFLAGHETSASALAWALYCLAQNPAAQAACYDEIMAVTGGAPPSYQNLRALAFTRDVWRETLRLYPPVPVLLREADQGFEMRGMAVAPGDILMVSPWYAQRHKSGWDDPDAFDPWRWGRGEQRAGAGAYLPFSKGARVCPGAGFATQEGVLMLALFLQAYRFDLSAPAPVPVAHLTVRSKAGIHLNLTPR